MKEISARYLVVKWWDPRNVAWWVFALMLLYSMYTTVFYLGQLAVQYPTASAIAIVGLTGIGLVWWAVLRRTHIFTRQDTSGTVAALLWGGLIATAAIAANANGPIIALIAKLVSLETAVEWGAAIAAPLTEETAKLLGMILILLMARHRLRTMTEGIILGMWVGLGFALVEDLLYVYNYHSLSFEENEVSSALLMVILRGIILGIPSHALMSAFAGAGLFFLWHGQGAVKKLAGVGLVLCSMLAHGLWNSNLLGDLGGRALFAVGFFLVFYALFKAGRRDEQAWLRRTLVGEIARDHVTHLQVQVIAHSNRLRRKHRNVYVQRYGPGVRQALRNLEGALLDLAHAVSMGSSQDVTAARIRLTLMLDHPEPVPQQAPAPAAPPRQYIGYDPSQGYPAGPNLTYECARCTVTLPSQPAMTAACQCRNVVIDMEQRRLVVRDHQLFRIFTTG